MEGRTDGQIKVPITYSNALVDGQKSGQTDRWREGQTDRSKYLLHTVMHLWVDGQTDGGKDGQIDQSTFYIQ